MHFLVRKYDNIVLLSHYRLITFKTDQICRIVRGRFSVPTAVLRSVGLWFGLGALVFVVSLRSVRTSGLRVAWVGFVLGVVCVVSMRWDGMRVFQSRPFWISASAKSVNVLTLGGEL